MKRPFKDIHSSEEGRCEGAASEKILTLRIKQVDLISSGEYILIRLNAIMGFKFNHSKTYWGKFEEVGNFLIH